MERWDRRPYKEMFEIQSPVWLWRAKQSGYAVRCGLSAHRNLGVHRAKQLPGGGVLSSMIRNEIEYPAERRQTEGPDESNRVKLRD